MVRQYGLWGAIASIFLLAIFGVHSAAKWLNGSTTANTNTDQTITLNGNNRNSEFITSTDGTTTQSNARFGDQSETREQETITFSPLEQAGTYVQRQKRVERDAVVAATSVEAIPIASSNNATPAQSDSRVNNQPTPTSVSNTDSTQPSSKTPATQVVPALW